MKEKETFAEKARRARSIRPIKGDYKGKNSTHLMTTVEYDGVHYAYPTITNKKAPYEGFVEQSFEEAAKAGELFAFDTHEEADSFAKGSWKLPLPSEIMGKENFIEPSPPQPFDK